MLRREDKRAGGVWGYGMEGRECTGGSGVEWMGVRERSSNMRIVMW